MGFLDIVRRAKQKMASANTAQAKAKRARDKIRHAQTRAQLETARAQLATAEMERKTKLLEAQALLQCAKLHENQARAELSASEKRKWDARYAHVESAIGGGIRLIKGLGGSSPKRTVRRVTRRRR